MTTNIKPQINTTVALQHWDGTVEKATIRRYNGDAVLLQYADGVSHWWTVAELRAALSLSN